MKNIVFCIFIFLLSVGDLQSQTKVESTEVSTRNFRKYKSDISDPTNTLSGKIETLELSYLPFGCSCASWIDVKRLKALKEDDTLGDKTIFIEPADSTLIISLDKFDLAQLNIVVKGQFYTKPDYPKGTEETEETGVTFKKVPVFRYTEMIIKEIESKQN